MFWKKKKPAVAPTSVAPTAAATGVTPTEAKAEAPKPEAEKLSPKDIVRQQVEQLKAGQTLIYQLGKIWGVAVKDELAVIELNPEYPKPKMGLKFILSTEKLVDGKPAGERTRLSDSNKPKDLASWVADREGKLFTGA